MFADDITIITPYVGQLLKIKQEADSFSLQVVVNEKDRENLIEIEGNCFPADQLIRTQKNSAVVSESVPIVCLIQSLNPGQCNSNPAGWSRTQKTRGFATVYSWAMLP